MQLRPEWLRHTRSRLHLRQFRGLIRGCQRLDETVVLARVRLVRDAGALALERVYRFEFSTNGADRCVGEVALLNTRPLWARLRHPDGALHVDLARTRR